MVGTILGKKQYFGLVDRAGEIKDMGYQFANVWSSTPPARPDSSKSTATRVVLTVGHPSIKTDFEDIAYVRAEIVDATGRRVYGATNSVTFSVAGTAGGIVGVENANPAGESYRGYVRTPYNGACWTLVQMKKVGSVTVSASASGLTGSSVTVTGSAGGFSPCRSSCDCQRLGLFRGFGIPAVAPEAGPMKSKCSVHWY